MFLVIKKNFGLGRWSKSMVRKAVVKGLISNDEYFKIIGEGYR